MKHSKIEARARLTLVERFLMVLAMTPLAAVVLYLTFHG